MMSALPLRSIVIALATVLVALAVMAAVSKDDPTITAEGNRWIPRSIEVSTGDGLIVHNADLVVHTFVVEELEIDINVIPGRRREVPIDAPAGSYRFICDVTGHAGMTGTIEVT
jgi:plastocyanin